MNASTTLLSSPCRRCRAMACTRATATSRVQSLMPSSSTEIVSSSPSRIARALRISTGTTTRPAPSMRTRCGTGCTGFAAPRWLSIPIHASHDRLDRAYHKGPACHMANPPVVSHFDLCSVWHRPPGGGRPASIAPQGAPRRQGAQGTRGMRREDAPDGAHGGRDALHPYPLMGSGPGRQIDAVASCEQPCATSGKFKSETLPIFRPHRFRSPDAVNECAK